MTSYVCLVVVVVVVVVLQKGIFPPLPLSLPAPPNIKTTFTTLLQGEKTFVEIFRWDYITL